MLKIFSKVTQQNTMYAFSEQKTVQGKCVLSVVGICDAKYTKSMQATI